MVSGELHVICGGGYVSDSHSQQGVCSVPRVAAELGQPGGSGNNVWLALIPVPRVASSTEGRILH